MGAAVHRRPRRGFRHAGRSLRPCRCRCRSHRSRTDRLAGRIRQHRVSVVLNLEGLDVEQQMRSAAAFLGGLFDAERDYWYPMLVVVDEAQLFAPGAAGEVSDEARKLSLGAMTNLMCRGRKRG